MLGKRAHFSNMSTQNSCAGKCSGIASPADCSAPRVLLCLRQEPCSANVVTFGLIHWLVCFQTFHRLLSVLAE